MGRFRRTVLRCTSGARNTPLKLAGKTGTPLFPADTLTLSEWRNHCARPADQSKVGQSRGEHHQQELARCGLSPYKWYAALTGDTNNEDWDKAVVVVTERNWNQRTGYVDSVEDKGSNVAAEIGLALANVLTSPSLINK
ncbi:hypothetical protein CCP3SC15_190029 [Gammaproteobacteria bacterium]